MPRMSGLTWPEAVNRIMNGFGKFIEADPDLSYVFHNYYFLQGGEICEQFRGEFRGPLSSESAKRHLDSGLYRYRVVDIPKHQVAGVVHDFDDAKLTNVS